MQRVEMEELRQQEANLTALKAIGPRKKPKLEPGLSPSLQVNQFTLNIIIYIRWFYIRSFLLHLKLLLSN